MRQAIIKYNHVLAGMLKELDTGEYEFIYSDYYIQNYQSFTQRIDNPHSFFSVRNIALLPVCDKYKNETSDWLNSYRLHQ